MSKDAQEIVERLRWQQRSEPTTLGDGTYRIVPDPLSVEAADLIERQAARIAELEAGLKAIRAHTQNQHHDELLVCLDMIAEDAVTPSVRSGLRSLLAQEDKT